MEIRKRNSKRSKRGLVLPFVAGIAICLALLGLAVLKLGFGSRLMATRTIGSISARAAADAGVTRALYEMNARFTMGGNPQDPSVIPPDVADMPLNNSNATYSYKVRGPFTELPEPYWMIESIGKLGPQVKTVYATLGVRNLFDYGLIVTDNITLNSGTLVDGYDTRLGPYTEDNPTNSHGYIRIGTTSVINRSILLHDTEVTGDVLGGVGSVVDGSGDSVIQNPSGNAITGPWYNLPEPWYFDPVTVPDAVYVPSGSIGNSTPWDGTNSYRIPEVVTGETVYLQYDNIDVLTGKNLIFLGPVVIIVNQDIEIDNSSNIYVGEPDPTFPSYPSSVTIYLNGDLLVRNGGNINNLSQIPLNFQLYGIGAPYQNWEIHNSGDYYGIYYGPNADIRTYATADFYGSISGHEFILFADGGLHYDHALSDIVGYDVGFGIDRSWEKSDFVLAAGP